jgi:drug/metabolite transporter (DMT)-like permease
MEVWIPITLAAAFLQNARSALQKHLKGSIGQAGAVFVRFGYGAPVALIYCAITVWFTGFAPTPNLNWTLFLVLGAMTQIGATYALLVSFDGAGFGVGTAYSKTEPIQAALFGAILLGEFLTPLALVAVFTGVGGVLILASSAGGWRTMLKSRSAAIGLCAAALFGVSAVSFRAASLSLDEGGFLVRAAITLAAATSFQAILMALWLRFFRPGELTVVFKAWKPGLAAGFAGAMASAGWFTAMTLEPVAHIRALAQVELVFTFAVSLVYFGERPLLRDYLGVFLILCSVLLLLLAVG